MSIYNSDSGELFFTKNGKSDHPLLILHGISYASGLFEPLVKKIKKKRSVIIPDLPGHGKSVKMDTFPPDYYINTSEILVKWLKKESYKKIDILGVRGGSVIAMNMAIKNPGMINKVIADSFPGKKLSNGKIDLIIQDAKNKKKSLWGKSVYHKYNGKNWKKIVSSEIEMLEKMKYTDYRHIVPGIGKIECEVLLTGLEPGSLLPGLKQTYEKLSGKHSNFEYHIFSNKKKFNFTFEHPDYKDYILDFLNK